MSISGHGTCLIAVTAINSSVQMMVPVFPGCHDGFQLLARVELVKAPSGTEALEPSITIT